MVSPLWPAAREQGEVIHVHSCAPGWTDIGGTCWPDPLTEPEGGGGEPGLPGGPDEGDGNDGPFTGGSGEGDLKKQHGCSVTQLASNVAKPCQKKLDDDVIHGAEPHYVLCTGQKKGKVVHPKMYCCQKVDGKAKCEPLN